ncbi:hypothetical protein [Deinococcus irradiatisoli]|uniref:hypothetical protein n=1 Tax=Deinococcus irradiatisoli TaxID=2202254 RepID=UPI0011B1F628|nr:hypothetical protein [Deinococcus irradiatisoli]
MTVNDLPPTPKATKTFEVSDAPRREVAHHAAESLRMEVIEVRAEKQLTWEQRVHLGRDGRPFSPEEGGRLLPERGPRAGHIALSSLSHRHSKMVADTQP